MHRRLLTGMLVLLLPLVARAAERDPVFDVAALRATPLDAKVLKTSEKDGIVTEEVQFHSHKDGAKRVDIFAYLSYPKGAKKLPAFIWNNGGLAQANTYWTTVGAKRGYVTFSIDFPLPGYRSTGNYPIVSGLALPEDPRQAPIYHGAIALLKAVTYLESRAEVDRERIGMAGSSWGGFYTTLMIGLDERLKVGASMFGSGGLELGNNWWDGSGQGAQFPPAFRRRWSETLDPALRLSQRKTPLAWFTGTNDLFYWLPSVLRSHERAAGPKHLALLPNYNHALTPALDEQVFAWLDIHLQGKEKFVAVSTLTIAEQDGKRYARWTSDTEAGVDRGELLVSPGAPGNWQSRVWITVPAIRQGKQFEAVIPAWGLPTLLLGSVTDKRGFRSVTTLQTVAAAKQPQPLKYDGCAEWGDWETPQGEFIRLHGYTQPETSAAAHTGKQSAVLKAGKFVTPPLLFTAGVPHRLHFMLKAAEATPLTVKLLGHYDGKPDVKETTVRPTTQWTAVSLDMTPPAEVKSGTLRLEITVPQGKSVQIDAVRLEPK